MEAWRDTLRLSLSRSIRSGGTLPHWIQAQFERLAKLPHLIPLEEMAEMAQPVWHLPRGLRAVAVVLSLTALVCGVRVLDAQIAGIDEPIVAAAVEQESAGVSAPEPPAAAPAAEEMGGAPTAMILESPPAGDLHRFLMVTVTGYTSSLGAEGGNGPMTATSRTPRPGTIALSRDLLRNFTAGAPFGFGDRVVVPGMGVYVVEDTMHPRWTHKADIWFGDGAAAREWGCRDVYITRINPGEPLLVGEFLLK
jgi:3D (Asp-Asp-Asp) domain-containing protein